jgi:hypothetical protein
VSHLYARIAGLFVAPKMSAAETALRKRIAQGGVAPLKAGVTEITQTLVLDRPGCGLIGASLGAESELRYVGDPSQSAIRATAGCHRFTLDRFVLKGPRPGEYQVPGKPDGKGGFVSDTPEKDYGVGIELGVHPTEHEGQGGIASGLLARNVTVSGFATGVKIGDKQRGQSCDTTQWFNLLVTDCRVGVVTWGGNSIGHRFWQLGLRSLYTGVQANSPNVFIDGGHSVFVGGDDGGKWTKGSVFEVAWDGHFEIARWWLEHSPSGLLVNNLVKVGHTRLVVAECVGQMTHLPLPTPPNERALVYAAGDCCLTARGCMSYDGGVLDWQSLPGGSGTVELASNRWHPAAEEVVEMDPSAPPTEFRRGTGRRLALPND